MSPTKAIKKIKKASSYFAVYLFLGILILTSYVPVSSVKTTNSYLLKDTPIKSDKGFSTKSANNQDQNSIFIKQDVRPEESGTSYTPVNELVGSSNNFSVIDTLNLSHHSNLNLNYSQAQNEIYDSYSISLISNYSADSLTYNIQDMTAIASYYLVQNDTTVGKYTTLSKPSPSYYRLAQKFEIKWDYAVFYGAKMFLTYDFGGAYTLGTYQMDIYLVPASASDGKPNMTNILSSDVNGPYSQSNQYNDIGWQFFDFTDVTLSKGTYYIVANLSVVDNNDDGTSYRHFAWARYEDGQSDGDTYVMDLLNNIWLQQAYDFSLLPYLLPSYSNGTALKFSNPQTINLLDNGQVITSTNSSINGIGLHTLTANTSISLTFNNTYIFNQNIDGSSILGNYRATNSTYWQYQVAWNVSWSTSVVDIAPYSNLNRTQLLIVPDDWSAVFNAYSNNSLIYSISRGSDGYYILCNDTVAYVNWNIIANSPNYIKEVSLFDDTIFTDRFLLGYWATNGTHATGYTGSKIVAKVLVQGGGGTPYNETTGYLNYTLFNNTGQIIPLKSSLPSRYIYNDPSSYSLTNIYNTSAGYYEPYIFFDPSINGSDTPGFWTASVLWQNGTEVGFYSLRIVVQTRTTFIAEWEEEPNSGNWVTNNVARRQYDEIQIRGHYYNISEAFFSGDGVPIPNADVSYSTGWSTSAQFVDNAPNYNTAVNVSASVGNYSITLLATGAFLENHTITFYVKVFYELDIRDVQYTTYETNYTNFAIYYLSLFDASAGSDLTTTPDYLSVVIGNSTLNITLTENTDYTFTYISAKSLWELNISTQSQNLAIGNYTLYYSVGYTDYRASYAYEYASQVFSLTITAPKTEIQIVSADNYIYAYHSATIQFRYMDTNHSVTITGDTIQIWSNISNVNIVWSENSGVYTVTITNNNPSATKIWIFLNISKSNYQSIDMYLLHEFTCLTNGAELTISNAPENITVYYNTSIIVYYNDTTHNESITGASLLSCTGNASQSLTVMSFIDMGGGYYNITFVNTDSNLQWLNVTIELEKAGYENGVASIILKVVFVSTEAKIVGDQTIQIYYLESTTFSLLYIDTESNVNITSNDVQMAFEGNITNVLTPDWYWSSNIYYLNISDFSEVGIYEIKVTISKPGYEQQLIVFYLIAIERPTHLEENSIDITIYADLTSQTSVSYFDDLNSSSLIPNGKIEYTFVNGSLDYFDTIQTGVQETLYNILLNPKEAVATGLTFVINFTIGKYGYENQSLVIYLTVIIRPTSLSAQDTELEIYTTSQATFTIYYNYSGLDTLVTGATIEVNSVNGTSDVNILSSFGNATAYYVVLSPVTSITADKTYLFNITLQKAGYESQYIIVSIHVKTTPTCIDSKTSEQWVYTTTQAVYVIYYNFSGTTNLISGGTIQIDSINSTSDVNIVSSFGNDTAYYVILDPLVSVSGGNTYLFNVTILKAGYETQSLVIILHVKITPTTANSEENEQWIYANENAEFVIFYYNNLTSEPLPLANVNVELNASEDLVTTPSVNYSPTAHGYVVTIDLIDSQVAGKTYVITLTISKQGYTNQTLIVYLHVYPKIEFTLTLFVVGNNVQQLSTIQFQVNLTENMLTILGMYDLLQYYSPMGDTITVSYFFIFTNGTQSSQYSVRFTITGYDNDTGVFYGRSDPINVPWQAKSLSATAEYLPSDSSVVTASDSSLNIPNVKMASISALLMYFFNQYTLYFALGLSAITLILVGITVYFVAVRPKIIQKRVKRRQYLDKVSKIISSVISMKKIIIVHSESGLPVFDWNFGGEMTVDSSLVSGFLQAVAGMGTELSGKAQAVKKLSYGDFVVSSSSGEQFTTYLFTTTEVSKDIEEGLTTFIQWFERRFAAETKFWDGDATVFRDNARQIVDRISEDLYVWTLYPLSLNPFKSKTKEIAKLPLQAQKIVKFVKESKEATISLILEYFNKQPTEEVLSTVFDLVNNQFLLRKRFRK